MCQLLAINANAPTAATFSFAGLCARGGDTGHHVDGWGLGFHDGHAPRVYRDTGRACDAPLAAQLQATPLRARNVLAHVRKATQGAVALDNCHPFERAWAGRRWLFAHNGDLKGFDPELGIAPRGQTDSERAFCWLLQELADTPPHWQQLAPALAELLPQVAAHGAFNLLLTDGHALYAHASTQLAWVERGHPFPRARLVDRDLEMDLAAANGPDDRMVVVATQPLTDDEPWRAFAPGELRVFVDGQPVWRRVLRRAAVAPNDPARRVGGTGHQGHQQHVGAILGDGHTLGTHVVQAACARAGCTGCRSGAAAPAVQARR